MRKSFLILLKKQPSLSMNGKVIWQASDYSLSKELHHTDLPKKILHPPTRDGREFNSMLNKLKPDN